MNLIAEEANKEYMNLHMDVGVFINSKLINNIWYHQGSVTTLSNGILELTTLVRIEGNERLTAMNYCDLVRRSLNDIK